MSLVRWGLIPSWAKDSYGAARMINARSETAAVLVQPKMEKRRSPLVSIPPFRAGIFKA